MRTLVIVVTLLLAGCGQKGPLYFPEAPAEDTPATDATPSQDQQPDNGDPSQPPEQP